MPPTAPPTNPPPAIPPRPRPHPGADPCHRDLLEAELVLEAGRKAEPLTGDAARHAADCSAGDRRTGKSGGAGNGLAGDKPGRHGATMAVTATATMTSSTAPNAPHLFLLPGLGAVGLVSPIASAAS
jgi:hypothetical protein